MIFNTKNDTSYKILKSTPCGRWVEISNVGKQLVKSEGDIRKRMQLPNKYDLLGIVIKNFGQARMNVKCQDGFTRICRVRGKMKKRRWVREGDVVLVSPWEFDHESRGDIVFRYTQNQAYWLRNNGYLKIDA